MEISISELRYSDPLRFIFGVFIPQPDYLIQELACPSAINFGVHYPRDFILRFPINYNQYRSWLCFFRKNIECGEFEHRHMEN